MKNTICITLLSLLFNYSYAQKCKEVADPITNEKKIEYVYAKTGLSSFGNLTYEVKNGQATLTKEFGYSGVMNKIAPEGTEIFFKLKNGEIVKLKTVKETTPRIGVVTGYNFVLGLTKEDLTKLAESPVILIRIPKLSEEGFIDINKDTYNIIKTKGPLKSGAACILTYL